MKARIVNGRVIVDEPTDLPEGTEWEVMLYDRGGDTLDGDERRALHRSLLRGIAEADAGQLVDADEALADLESRR